MNRIGWLAGSFVLGSVAVAVAQPQVPALQDTLPAPRTATPGTRQPVPLNLQDGLPPPRTLPSPTTHGRGPVLPVAPAPAPVLVPGPGTGFAPRGMPLPGPAWVGPAGIPGYPPPGVPFQPGVGSSGMRPALDALKGERDELTKQRRDLQPVDPGTAAEEFKRAEMRLEIDRLLKRMDRKPPPGKVEGPKRPPAVPGVPVPPPETVSTDPLTLPQTQFRAGQFDAALKSLRALDPTTLTTRDRAWVQYLSACCLRQMGKLTEAAAIYREIASAREDDFLSESAVWQLSFLRWREEAQAGIAELRR